MAIDEPKAYRVERIRQASMTDERVQELELDVRIAGERVFVSGIVPTERRDLPGPRSRTPGLSDGSTGYPSARNRAVRSRVEQAPAGSRRGGTMTEHYEGHTHREPESGTSWTGYAAVKYGFIFLITLAVLYFIAAYLIPALT